MKEGVRAHKTLLNYRERMKLFYAYIQEYREDVENIEDVTPRVIKDYMDYMSERGNNKGTVFNFFRVLRTLLNWYERYTDYEYRSPLFKVDTPIVKVKPLPGIPVEDIKKMVQDCNGRNVVRDKAILQFLLDTGVRAFELLAVNLEDVDMVTGQVIVRHGKGDKERTVFFGTKTRTALRNYLKTRGEYKRPFDPLFMSDRDGRLTLSGLRQIVRRRAEAVGLPEPGLHDFRRAFCVTMYRNGVDLVTLSRLMGHSTLEVLKRYIKEDVADLARAHAQASPVDTKLR